MPSLAARLADGWDYAAETPSLALVPVVSALLQVDQILRVVQSEGGFFGVTTGFPPAVVDVWRFVNVPNDVGVGTAATLDPTLPLWTVPLFLVVRSVLAAGYLGSVRQLLAGEPYDFGANVARYGVPMFVYLSIPTLFVHGGLAVAHTGAVVDQQTLGRALPFVVGLAVAGFVLSYLFYGAPYLIVLRGDGVVDALVGSVRLAVSDGRYLWYGLAFLGVVAVGSVGGTAVVVNFGLVGTVFGALLFAPFALALSFATMRLVADVDERSPTFEAWEETARPPEDDARPA